MTKEITVSSPELFSSSSLAVQSVEKGRLRKYSQLESLSDLQLLQRAVEAGSTEIPDLEGGTFSLTLREKLMFEIFFCELFSNGTLS